MLEGWRGSPLDLPIKYQIGILGITLFSYLLGSIPFGLSLTKLAGLGDIRQIGSGNIGATNVLRTGKKGLAALTLLLDGGKGALAVFLAYYAYDHYFFTSEYDFDQNNLDYTCLAAFAAFIGHLFPVWLKFKGGKGVATTFGIMLGVLWPVGLAAILLWILVALVTRYSSLAALISIGLIPIMSYVGGEPHVACLGFILFGFILYKHKDNMHRLIAGTESKIGKSR